MIFLIAEPIPPDAVLDDIETLLLAQHKDQTIHDYPPTPSSPPPTV